MAENIHMIPIYVKRFTRLETFQSNTTTILKILETQIG